MKVKIHKHTYGYKFDFYDLCPAGPTKNPNFITGACEVVQFAFCPRCGERLTENKNIFESSSVIYGIYRKEFACEQHKDLEDRFAYCPNTGKKL